MPLDYILSTVNMGKTFLCERGKAHLVMVGRVDLLEDHERILGKDFGGRNREKHGQNKQSKN